jgi:hypothetical protein
VVGGHDSLAEVGEHDSLVGVVGEQDSLVEVVG